MVVADHHLKGRPRKITAWGGESCILITTGEDTVGNAARPGTGWSVWLKRIGRFAVRTRLILLLPLAQRE